MKRPRHAFGDLSGVIDLRLIDVAPVLPLVDCDTDTTHSG